MSHRRNGRFHGNPLIPHHMREEIVRAERDAKTIQGMAQQLSQIPEAKGILVLGEVAHQAPYAQGGPTDSGRVFQAAIKIPEGLGVILWDSEEFIAFEDDPRGKQQTAKTKFVPFCDCPAIVKAKLIRHTGAMITRLFGIVDGRQDR